MSGRGERRRAPIERTERAVCGPQHSAAEQGKRPGYSLELARPIRSDSDSACCL